MENIDIEQNGITIDTVLELSETLHILKLIRNSIKYNIDTEDLDISIDKRDDEETLLEITIRYSENIESMGIKYMPDTTYDIDIKTNLREDKLLKILDGVIDEIAKSFYYCTANCNKEDLNDCCEDEYIIERLKEKGINIR
ncbi:MAG: hypothetical protein QXW71_06515 [Thermoplasmata archaeon]